MDLFEIGQAPRFERRGAAAHSKQVLKYTAGRDSADNDRVKRRRGPQLLRWGRVARTNVIGGFA